MELHKLTLRIGERIAWLGLPTAFVFEGGLGQDIGIHTVNVLEGFEGELDAAQQRGGQDGWRFHGLPWVQD